MAKAANFGLGTLQATIDSIKQEGQFEDKLDQ